TVPSVLISATPPGPVVPNCGTEMKKELVAGFHTDCSSPPVASPGMTMWPCTMAPLLAFTSVPNAGVSALLATSTRLAEGEYDISSTRKCPPVLIGENRTGGGRPGLLML